MLAMVTIFPIHVPIVVKVELVLAVLFRSFLFLAIVLFLTRVFLFIIVVLTIRIVVIPFASVVVVLVLLIVVPIVLVIIIPVHIVCILVIVVPVVEAVLWDHVLSWGAERLPGIGLDEADSRVLILKHVVERGLIRPGVVLVVECVVVDWAMRLVMVLSVRFLSSVIVMICVHLAAVVVSFVRMVNLTEDFVFASETFLLFLPAVIRGVKVVVEGLSGTLLVIVSKRDLLLQVELVVLE